MKARNLQRLPGTRRTSRITVAAAILAAAAALAGTAAATHAWGGFHWARTATPFTLKLVDSVDATWDAHLATTSADWSASTVLDTSVVAGGADAKTRRRCAAVTGQVRVCNYAYGNNGWLGVASVWLSGPHIVRATAKMNDTYFNLPAYNTPAWRNHVMCQEVGHTLGLDHQDESGASLGTCMDYATDPTASQHPNAHDYAQLEAIYAHLDSTSTVASTAPTKPGRPRPLRGRDDVWVQDLGAGRRVVHFVTWAIHGPHTAPDLT